MIRTCLAVFLWTASVTLESSMAGPGREGSPKAATDARESKAKEKDRRRVEKERERADLNHDGRVDASEAEAAKNAWYRERGLKFDGPWGPSADGDGDGRISATELYEFKKALLDDDGDGALSPDDYRRFFKHVRSLIQTPREKRFDRSGDGFLDGSEALEMLKDRLSGLKGGSKRPVESKFDRLFDSNIDGQLSPEEAAAIELAIGQ